MKWIVVSLVSLICAMSVLPGCSLWSRPSPATARPVPAATAHESDKPTITNLIPGLNSTAGATESNPQYVTEEDLLKVVNEFQRVAAKDSYRFPLPKDVTGANVYKATLT